MDMEMINDLACLRTVVYHYPETILHLQFFGQLATNLEKVSDLVCRRIHKSIIMRLRTDQQVNPGLGPVIFEDDHSIIFIHDFGR